MDYDDWFGQVSGGGRAPHAWQAELAAAASCDNRLIRIPTGFGKTLGVLAAWLYHRIQRRDPQWPRRLVWCLPMRTLVEQTCAEAEDACRRANALWLGEGEPAGKVAVRALMGGVDAGEWQLWPEANQILVGTQDMLLSRALNRGYASPRARWPVEFGLLGQDCLWVMDEVQLMDVGLATSAQLQAFRDQDASRDRSIRGCRTWWMSATLQREWLRSVDTTPWLDALPTNSIPASGRRGALWEVTKPTMVRDDLTDPKALAAQVVADHAAAGAGRDGPTLVVVNTVDRAIAVTEAIRNTKGLGEANVRLVHSRFRPAERKAWRTDFLCREACGPGTNRIVVATQVVEAGVDFSAAVLFTDIAPWPSLVQRVGRVARWGGRGRITVVDTQPKDDAAAAPYTKVEMDGAREALEALADLSPASLEQFEESSDPRLIARLYPYEPSQLLLRHELDELFDTAPDLSGGDIDVSRFIRSGDERDVSVFWGVIPRDRPPAEDVRPSRDALCAVPFLRARDWLCGKESKTKRAPRLKKRRIAWVWSWLDGAWREAERRDLYPGQTVLVDAEFGGYDWDADKGEGSGWNPDHRGTVRVVALDSKVDPAERTDGCQDDEALSEYAYRTIATHGRQVAEVACGIARELAPAIAPVIELAALWHDAGKAHPAFQGSIRAPERPSRQDLAKAPKHAWPRSALYQIEGGERRRGFRHELASTLALFAVLQSHAPDHVALLGPWRELLEELGQWENPTPTIARLSPSEAAVVALSAPEFDLLSYLVCAHHGKVRASWHPSPADQDTMDRVGELTIRGIRTGDALAVAVDVAEQPSARTLDLSPATAGLSPRTGRSWTERVLGLVERHGPFTLAWMEAIVRAADQRASRLNAADPLLRAESEQ